MYAIIKTGGKQYKVSEGDILNVDKLSKEPKDTIEFTEVIAVNDGKALTAGEAVASAVVTAEVIVEGRDKRGWIWCVIRSMLIHSNIYDHEEH